MALNRKGVDPYFRGNDPEYARTMQSNWWSSPQYKLDGVAKEDVTCDCGYVASPDCFDPKRAFRSHMRRNHRAEYVVRFKPPFVIKEEDEFVLPEEIARLLANA